MARMTRGMILAAGLGTRLRPLTYFRAKAAVPFLNRPLISYSLEVLQRAQVEEVVVNLHHLPETVRAAVARESFEVQFSFEEEILGTAGCLRRVRDFFGECRIVVANGKTYLEQDLREVLDYHESAGALITMVLVPYTPGDPYNPVMLDSDGFIVGFARNRPQIPDIRSSARERLGIYTGVQILEPEVLDWIPPGTSDSVNDVYPRLMSRGYPIRGFVSTSYWCECSTTQRYLVNSLEVLGLRNRKNLSSTELPQGCRGAILGDRVDVPSDTLVENSLVWGDIKLGRRSSFRGVIITDGVRELPPDTHLRDAIVTPIIEGQEEFNAVAKIGDRYALWPIS